MTFDKNLNYQLRDCTDTFISGSYNNLPNKPAIPSVVQTKGSSTTDNMSQDAITTAISGKASVSTYSVTLIWLNWKFGTLYSNSKCFWHFETNEVFAYIKQRHFGGSK